MYMQYGSEEDVGLVGILPTVRLTKESLQLVDQHTVGITIRYVGAREMKRLNKKHRSNRLPGNILTFCTLGSNSKQVCCDLILYHRLILKESLNYNKTTQSYYMELFAKGILNVQECLV
ncbi:rRNA maturation RNAse YbeY [Candidatus Tremblaya phenacola]|uniref:Endoribonuclease YbeY n=1 Tax=Candidatus Tremblayella phenacoccinincola TaxID=1010676 RepID=A0A2G0V764_9PROT|nr:rRNA maturation RNAse YbeY [Candidatus Tremblaya phenacola]PHN16315.1 Endoribonuclease YbeY [Candidatus Tremblaya phenacola]